MTSQKVSGFVLFFWTTYMRKVHILKYDSLVHQMPELLKLELLKY